MLHAPLTHKQHLETQAWVSYPTLFLLRTMVLILISVSSHLTANCSSASWRSSPDQANKTPSFKKSKDEILRPTKRTSSTTVQHLNILSIRIMTRIVTSCSRDRSKSGLLLTIQTRHSPWPATTSQTPHNLKAPPFSKSTKHMVGKTPTPWISSRE